MLQRQAWLAWGVLVCVLGIDGTAQAGPVEQLNGVSISASTPENMVLPYTAGGGGLFLSQDGGKTLSWLCAAGIATSANNARSVTFLSGDDHIYLGMFDGLLRGDADGCGFERVPELEKRFVRAITSDPIEPKRTYVTTSNPMMDNYIYMSDGSSAFAPLGAATPLWIDTLDVVKKGNARRYYETVVQANAMTNEVSYSVRVSDDEAQTWTEEKFDLLDPMDKARPEFSIVAVDPNDPDRVLGRVWRSMGQDALVLSTQQGKSGSWKVIAQPMELGGAAFTPDGKVYYGESDSMLRGLYVIEGDGAEAQRLNADVRVFCVHYDAASQRLLGCANNYWFGTFDMASGTLSPLLDMRCAEHAVRCADKPEIEQLCQPPGVEFCKLDHWLNAPLCSVYDRGPEFCQYANAQDFTCAGGMTVSKPEGAPVAACSQVESAVSAAGSGAPAAGSGGTGTPGVDPSKSGCGCSSVGSSRPGGLLAVLLLLAAVTFSAARRARGRL